MNRQAFCNPRYRLAEMTYILNDCEAAEECARTGSRPGSQS